MEKLTPNEKKTYDYIRRMINDEGFAPSVRDICNACGIKSTATVHSYLNKLEEKGWIKREGSKSRAMRIEEPIAHSEPRRTAKIPVLGNIRAGMPILAVENHEDYIDFPMMNRAWSYNELFALRVRGESMIGAGILDGDIVVVKKEQAANNGDIVVALIEDEDTLESTATLKTLYRENGYIRLQPENPTMEPIIVTEAIILGRVIANFRYYN